MDLPPDDLPPDDDDFDLPPPPKPAAKKVVVVNLDDDDDDLPPPRPRAVPVDLPPDDDDDLPPPPVKVVAAPPPQHKDPVAAAKPAATLAPPPAPQRAVSPSVAKREDPDAAARRARAQDIMALGGSRVILEGWLHKQNPGWPYTFKQRYCQIKGNNLAYFDRPPTAGAPLEPLGHIELKSGRVTTGLDKEAKRAHAFGLSGPMLTHKDSQTSRVYVFAADTKEDLQRWVVQLNSAVLDAANSQELHWFEKMAQGTY